MLVLLVGVGYSSPPGTTDQLVQPPGITILDNGICDFTFNPMDLVAWGVEYIPECDYIVYAQPETVLNSPLLVPDTWPGGNSMVNIRTSQNGIETTLLILHYTVIEGWYFTAISSGGLS